MLLKIFIFIMGSLAGSFFNVCIYRLPRGESIVYPSSHCVHCNHNIPWFGNIPFLSYINLRGRCRFCNRRISPRYFLVEMLTGLIILTLFLNFGLSAKFFLLSVLYGALIISTFIDFEFHIIPDEITIPGTVSGLIASFLFPSLLGDTGRYSALFNSFLGAIAGGASIYAVGVLGKMVFKKEAMGGGDVKLMAMIGAFLGWKLVMLVFFIAPFFGALVGIFLKIKYKKDVIAYGPYISLAALIAVIWGGQILNFIFPL